MSTNRVGARSSRGISRRTFLSTSATAGAAAASFALVGCGDDDDDKSPSASPAATQPAAGGASPAAASPAAASPAASPSSAAVRRGGILRFALPQDPGTLDPMAGNSFTVWQVTGFVYEKLFRYKAGPGQDPGLFETEPCLAESATASADGLTYTVKLKRGVKWHAPVSRELDADDVVYSWRRWIGEIAGKPANPSAANDVAIIDTVEKVDNYTVVFKLKKIQGDFFARYSELGFWQIAPRESGTAFDPAQKMVGTGPWMFDSLVPGTVLKLKRNPEWHMSKEAPYVDAVELNYVPEYATRLNQFLAGNIDTTVIQGRDLGRAKGAIKDLQVVITIPTLNNGSLNFQGADLAPNAPWRDPRVRAAISMAIDRNAMLEAAYDLKTVEGLGFKVPRRFNNVTSSMYPPFWLDPQGGTPFKAGDTVMKKENQAKFKYSPADAKKLLEAAGFKDGFKTSLHTTAGRYGAAFDQITELMQAYLGQVGITAELKVEDYNALYLPETVVKGNFDGIAHIAGGGGVRIAFWAAYLPSSIGYRNSGHINDPVLTDRINKMLENRDAEATRKDILSIQDLMADTMYRIPTQNGAVGDYNGFAATMKNTDFQTQGYSQGSEVYPYYWRSA